MSVDSQLALILKRLMAGGSMERIQVYFSNCELPSSEKGQIVAKISYYLGLAPSDASCCSCISKNNDQFVCNMRVHSAKGHLHIHRESRSLETLLKFVYDSLKTSFEQWHRDPNHFAKTHPIGSTPCRDEEHRVIKCPYQSFANQKFEAERK